MPLADALKSTRMYRMGERQVADVPRRLQRHLSFCLLSQACLSRCAVAGAESSCAGGAQTQTVPYLIDNPEVGYVQTRWVFVNPDESYLTKVGCLRGRGARRHAGWGQSCSCVLPCAC